MEREEEENLEETFINPSVLRMDVAAMRMAASSEVSENLLEDLGGLEDKIDETVKVLRWKLVDLVGKRVRDLINVGIDGGMAISSF